MVIASTSKLASLAWVLFLVFVKHQAVHASSRVMVNEFIDSRCEAACQDLQTEFGPDLHYPDEDTDFSIWDQKQKEVRPACRVEPTIPEDVSKIMTIVTTRWCRFAVKGGGHAQAIDASNSVGGVTIDMRKMNRLEISADRTKANLGPGLVLGEVYRALEPHNLTFIGGRVADVGIAGYTLGGGVSNLSPQYGLAVDNVYEYEVVLPNATIVTVNEHVNSDLYFALRGGGNNFGIVVNFLVRLVPQGTQWGGDRTYHAKYTDQILLQVQKWSTTLSTDLSLCFSTRYAYNQTTDSYTMGVTQAYFEPIEFPAVFQQVNELPYESSSLRVDHMSNFAQDAISPHGARHLYATVTFDASEELHRRILQIFEEEVERVKFVEGFAPAIVTQSLHPNAIKAMKARGGNALGVQAEGPLNFALLTFGWANAKDDAIMSDFADRWVARSVDAAKSMGLYNRWRYINYSKENQDPFSGYAEGNKLRLKQIQESIDPWGVFNSSGLCRGSFKLS